MEATEQASNGFWATHMSGPFLWQTEEHRCSSRQGRVVVCGSSLLKRQTRPACVLLMDPW